MTTSFDDLYFYEAVVRNRGFSAAARELGVAKSVLSRRVRHLEERLAVRLIERSSSHFEVSEIGRDVFRHAHSAKLELEEAGRAAARLSGEPRGLVRVAIMPGGPAHAISEGLPDFLERHPRIRFQLIVSNRRSDLIEDRIDVAVRSRSDFAGEGDYVVKRLVSVRNGFVASPALAARVGRIEGPADLTPLGFLGNDEMHPEEMLTVLSPDGREHKLRIEPRFASNSLPLVIDAAIAGLGVAFVPDVVAKGPVAESRLVRLLPDWHGPESVFHIVFTSRRAMLPAVRVCIDFIFERLKHLVATA
ncbi:LysR family transcriptional regulator [Jiella endophytica]|uniref:LysR family transcriptional regulator n=1 Tax=Jiella endophytica TaxID=2558362 RepID=A0A4Y8RBB1_9HYPH|nr:LysR family transcriptional regulator [Jiella endophytica]TFF19103.1 LysR family transcriptional regulator [Jiella endophytica]